MCTRVASCILTLMIAASAQAGDWPQWLGPARDGLSTEKIAPWKGEPKVLWRKPVGEGHSSPVVAGGLVFLHTKVAGEDAEQVQAFDAKTGEVKWEKTYDKAHYTTPFGNGPRATPSVADGKLFTYGITGVLTCWEAASGKEMWKVDALKEFKSKNLFFGVSASPLAVGHQVVCLVGGKAAGMVSFDSKTGKILWHATDDPGSYSSPILWEDGKLKQIVALSGANLLGLDPASGEVFWKMPFKDRLNESSCTPARFGNLLLVGSITNGSIAVKLDVKDSKPGLGDTVWKDPKLTCYFTTPIPLGKEHALVVIGEPKLAGASADLCCLETSTGKVAWRKPKIATYHAGLLGLGDGKILMFDDNGNLVLLAPNAKEYEELSRSRIFTGKDMWAHPALSDGLLYLRDGKELVCLAMSP